MSAAALVRTVDSEGPTLLLDEADAAFGADKEYSETLRGVLNEGFRRGGNVRKVEGKNHKLRIFQVFGAKAIAGIGKIPDTVASRSIVIEMRRKAPTERVSQFRLREVTAQARPLAESLEAWASSERCQVLRDARPLVPDELSDRQKDISEPLLAIAEHIGGEWPEMLRKDLVALFRSPGSGDESHGVILLRDIRGIFEQREDDRETLKGIHSADLAGTLCLLEGHLWADWGKGRGLDANRLARLLKKYSISPRSLRLGDSNQRGYLRTDFEDAWLRYCPASSNPTSGVTCVTGVTSSTNTDENADACAVSLPLQQNAAITHRPASMVLCDVVTTVTALANTSTVEPEMLEGEL
jgi:hypothetical protein